MAVDKYESSIFVRRVLRHLDFNTKEKRMGLVLRASSVGIYLWRLHREKEFFIDWI